MIMHVTQKETNLKLIQTLYENNKNTMYYLAFDILKDEEAAEDTVGSCISRLFEICDLYSHMSYQQLEQLAHVLIRYLAYSMPEAQSNKIQNSSEHYGGFTREELPLLTLRYVYKLTPYEIGKLTGASRMLIRRKIRETKQRFQSSLKQEK